MMTMTSDVCHHRTLYVDYIQKYNVNSKNSDSTHIFCWGIMKVVLHDSYIGQDIGYLKNNCVVHNWWLMTLRWCHRNFVDIVRLDKPILKKNELKCEKEKVGRLNNPKDQIWALEIFDRLQWIHDTSTGRVLGAEIPRVD